MSYLGETILTKNRDVSDSNRVFQTIFVELPHIFFHSFPSSREVHPRSTVILPVAEDLIFGIFIQWESHHDWGIAMTGESWSIFCWAFSKIQV